MAAQKSVPSFPPDFFLTNLDKQSTMSSPAEDWNVGDKIRTGDKYMHTIVKIGQTTKLQAHDKTKLVASVCCNDCGCLVEFDLDKLSQITAHSMHRRDRLTAHEKTNAHKAATQGGAPVPMDATAARTVPEVRTGVFPFYLSARLQNNDPTVLNRVLKEMAQAADEQVSLFFPDSLPRTCTVVREPHTDPNATAVRVHWAEMYVNKDQADLMRESVKYGLARKMTTLSASPAEWEEMLLNNKEVRLREATVHCVLVSGKVHLRLDPSGTVNLRVGSGVDEHLTAKMVNGDADLLHDLTTVRTELTSPRSDWTRYVECPPIKPKLLQPKPGTSKKKRQLEEQVDLVTDDDAIATIRGILCRLSPAYAHSILHVYKVSVRDGDVQHIVVLEGEGCSCCVKVWERVGSASKPSMVPADLEKHYKKPPHVEIRFMPNGDHSLEVHKAVHVARLVCNVCDTSSNVNLPFVRKEAKCRLTDDEAHRLKLLVLMTDNDGKNETIEKSREIQQRVERYRFLEARNARSEPAANGGMRGISVPGPTTGGDKQAALLTSKQPPYKRQEGSGSNAKGELRNQQQNPNTEPSSPILELKMHPLWNANKHQRISGSNAQGKKPVQSSQRSGATSSLGRELPTE